MSQLNQEILQSIQVQAQSVLNKYGKGSLYHKPNKKPQFTFFYDDETGTKRRKTISIPEGADPQQIKLEFITKVLIKQYELQQEQKRRQLLQETISKDFLEKIDRIVEALPETKKVIKPCNKTVAQVLDEYILDCKARNLAYVTYSTNEQRTRKIKELIGKKQITEVTSSLFQEMLNGIRIEDNQLPSENYLKSIKNVMIGTLKYAKRQGYIESYSNILEDIQLPNNLKRWNPDSKFLDYEQLARVIYAARDNKRYFTIITVLTLTGLRSQELYGLRKQDIDYKNHRLRIVQAVVKNERKTEGDLSVAIGQTKNRFSERYVPAIDSVLRLLANWIEYTEQQGLSTKAKRKGNEDLVFINRAGSITDRVTINKAFGLYINEVIKREQLKDIPHFSFSMCRHCFATYLFREGCDLQTIQQCMGHTTKRGSTTQIHYIASDPTYVQTALPYLEQIEKKLMQVCKEVQNEYR